MARNLDEESSLPYLILVPLEGGSVVLKARDTWPRTAKVYCHRADGWPANPEVVERVRVRSCVRRGAAVDLVLDRSRENRSQIVFTRLRGGREAIFWQTARTVRQARPNVGLPRARSAAGPLTIVVDSHERYPWKFAHQQADTIRRVLPVGDYAVDLDGAVVAAVERKSLPDLVASVTSGKLRYLLAELATLPRRDEQLGRAEVGQGRVAAGLRQGNTGQEERQNFVVEDGSLKGPREAQGRERDCGHEAG